MHEFVNCTIVAELIKKSRKTIQTGVMVFNEGVTRSIQILLYFKKIKNELNI